MQHDPTVFAEVLAVPDWSSSLSNQARQFPLALDQRQRDQVTPIEVEKIENVVDEPLALAGLERRLQSGKSCDAVLLDDDLPVDQGGAGGKTGDGDGDVGKPAGPIESLAG